MVDATLSATQGQILFWKCVNDLAQTTENELINLRLNYRAFGFDEKGWW
tara:strand:- start:296 stop:442 length:147 start_codon:yes stop_codon:yes gene_type:complete